MASLKYTANCGYCWDEKSYVSLKLYNEKAKFLRTFDDEMEYMYNCSKCQHFIYPQLRGSSDERTETFIINNCNKIIIKINN